MMSEQMRAIHQARPFRSFTIHLADGTSVLVEHPELIFQTQGGETIFVNTKGEEVSIIDVDLVTKVTYRRGSPRKRRR